MAWRSFRGRQIIVNLEGDQAAIAGLLFDTSKRLLVLRRAQLLPPGGEPVAIDGEVVIERARVTFVQALDDSPERRDRDILGPLAAELSQSEAVAVDQVAGPVVGADQGKAGAV